MHRRPCGRSARAGMMERRIRVTGRATVDTPADIVVVRLDIEGPYGPTEGHSQTRRERQGHQEPSHRTSGPTGQKSWWAGTLTTAGYGKETRRIQIHERPRDSSSLATTMCHGGSRLPCSNPMPARRLHPLQEFRCGIDHVIHVLL